MEDDGKTKRYDLCTDYEYGFNPRTVNNLKQNRGITVYTLERLCNILPCTPNDILMFTTEEE